MTTSNQDPGDRVLAAEAEVAARRAQLNATIAELKVKANPRRLARRAVVEATNAGETAALAGVETARRYPGTLSGLVAVAGLFLARHRIGHLFRRLRGHDDHDETAGADLS